jgi:hypothetical protein
MHGYDRDWPERRGLRGGTPRYERDYRSAPRYEPRYSERGAQARRRHHHRPPEWRLHPERDAEWARPSHRRAMEGHHPWHREWVPRPEWWHAVGPEPRSDYDWMYGAGNPDRYGWTGETGRH